MVFHVDYWDRLGWKDPFASSGYTARQRAYVSARGGSRVYTPGFFLNGSEWRGFFSRRNIPDPENRQAGLLKAAQGGDGSWRITFKPADQSILRWDVCAARLGTGIRSDVKSGENHGRELSHDFTVLSFKQSDMKQEAGEFVATLRLPPSQANAPARLAIAVWVSPAGKLTPTQALGGWLQAPAKAIKAGE